jgi:hypothetical protein
MSFLLFSVLSSTKFKKRRVVQVLPGNGAGGGGGRSV